jgi:hypothetical protein
MPIQVNPEADGRRPHVLPIHSRYLFSQVVPLSLKLPLRPTTPRPAPAPDRCRGRAGCGVGQGVGSAGWRKAPATSNLRRPRYATTATNGYAVYSQNGCRNSQTVMQCQRH